MARGGSVLAAPLAVAEAAGKGQAVINPKSTTTTSTATATITEAPKPWTMDVAMMWLVTCFYVAVTAAAAVYFVKRWRKRAYGRGSSLSGRGAGGREDRATLRGDGGDAGFIATIGAIIDRATSHSALYGAAAWEGNARPLRGNNGAGTQFRSGTGTALLRKIVPYLPGAQGRAAAARRNKEKAEAAGEAVEVEVGGGGGNCVVSGVATGRAEGSPSPGGADGGGVPPSEMPSTMTARDPGH